MKRRKIKLGAYRGPAGWAMANKKIKPAVYRGPARWGWVSLKELAEVIGQSPMETWDNFFGLTKDIQYNVLAWSSNLDDMVQDGTYPGEFNSIFVPAGWAMDVLRAFKLGAVRIETKFHEHLSRLDGCPQGTLLCSFNGSGFTAAVGVKEDGSPVDACERPAPRTESACCHGCLNAGKILPGHSICGFPSEEGMKALDEGRAYLILEHGRGWQLVYDE